MSASDEIYSWIADHADRAESELRNMHSKAKGRELPDEIEAALDRQPDTADGHLGRYMLARHYLRLDRGDYAQQDQDENDDLLAMITREPKVVTLTPTNPETGESRRLAVYPKSIRSYTLMARLWGYVQLLDEELAGIEEAGVPASELRTIHRARRKRDEILHQMLAIAVAPEPTPYDTEDEIEVPDWVRDLTHQDIYTIQIAHLEVGPARFSALPDPQGGGDTRSSRGGFGAFISQLSKRERMKLEDVEREDVWALLGKLHALSEKDGDAAEELDPMDFQLAAMG